MRIPFAGPWVDFAAFTRRLRVDNDLVSLAEVTRDRVLREIASALDEPHAPLVEDYFVFEVERFEEPIDGSTLLGPCADAIARLVLCEERRIVPVEAADAMRVNFAYFDDDLAVVQWDTAFVYDRSAGASPRARCTPRSRRSQRACVPSRTQRHRRHNSRPNDTGRAAVSLE